MKVTIFRIIVFLFYVVWASGFAAAENGGMIPMGIVTGGAKGTYYQFGLNMEQLVKQHLSMPC